MKLSELIRGIEIEGAHGPLDAEIFSLGFDSREVSEGQLFFALSGSAADGHDYIGAALERGAVAVVCERMPEDIVGGVAYVCVADSNKAMGVMASRFYGNPSAKLNLVGITGTNGKTTTATLLYDLFRMLGYKAGLISTVVYKINDRSAESTHTTPDALRLNALLAQMVEAGCEYCFMEVSSHSIVQGRICGLHFTGGVFSNITHDHLDYHVTFAEYIRAKKAFFDNLPKGAFALINADDRNGEVMVQNSRANVKTYSLRSMADFRCRVVEAHPDGMLLAVNDREVWVKFLGRFNAYNLLSVYGTAMLLGAEPGETLQAMSMLGSVNGRFEYIRSADGITAIVDYAHTPDALNNVIETVNEIRRPGQKLYVVVGCGGDRDAAKRPVMGRIAAQGADVALLTSDNPRTEDPRQIIAQMEKGIPVGAKYLAITDRRQAIRTAVMMASEGDIIIVAGKGHETYQDVAGVKHPFDDKHEITAAFENK